MDVSGVLDVQIFSLLGRLGSLFRFHQTSPCASFDNQFCFRKNHSTFDALILIVAKLQRAVEEGNYSCGIFIDLSKAFDTVNHNILLGKLERYGIHGIAKDWFASYLYNREQFVSIGNIVSNK